LTGGGGHNSFGVPTNVAEDDVITIPELDEFARKQWEGVLGYMVGSSTGVDLSNSGVELSPGVQHLLRGGGLVDIKGRRVEITQDGFAFLLQEVNAQVWTMLILYLQAAEKVRIRSLSVRRSSQSSLIVS
jgi:transcription initiation factor TFIIH subunit 4